MMVCVQFETGTQEVTEEEEEEEEERGCDEGKCVYLKSK